MAWSQFDSNGNQKQVAVNLNPKTNVATGNMGLPGGQAASTFLMSNAAGSALVLPANMSAFYVPTVSLNTTLYPSISGYTTKFRLVAGGVCNSTAPGGTQTLGLSIINTSTGLSSGNVNVNVGSQEAGSTISFSISATQQFSGVSSGFTMPTDGIYAVTLVTTGTSAANSTWDGSWALQLYYV